MDNDAGKWRWWQRYTSNFCIYLTRNQKTCSLAAASWLLAPVCVNVCVHKLQSVIKPSTPHCVCVFWWRSPRSSSSGSVRASERARKQASNRARRGRYGEKEFFIPSRQRVSNLILNFCATQNTCTADGDLWGTHRGREDGRSVRRGRVEEEEEVLERGRKQSPCSV